MDVLLTACQHRRLRAGMVIPGAILAVPIMAAIKIVCDHIESLAPVGEFLGK